MARTGKLSPEARDDHYHEFDRLLGPPSASGPRRSKGACPPLSQITVPEEMFWLTVMLAQMRWPWPRDIRNALADLPRSSRFSVEQARYLLRHDPELTALHAAKAGALIAGWPADLATKALLEMARQRQSPAADELTGRWPLPTGSERRQWEEDKNTFFRERHRHLTRDEKVAWLCLAYGQMGWPLPSLLTRIFPIDWTRRKMDSALLANIFSAIAVADAAVADVQVKGLDRKSVLDAADSWASFERSREAEAKAGGIPAFVMFRDKLPRTGPQGRLYRQLFDQALTVLQSEGQQPGDRLQLLDFLNRQTTVDGELARQKSVTDAAGDQGSHLGIRVSAPPAPRTAPKVKYPLPKVEPGLGIIYEPYTEDDEDEDEYEEDEEDNDDGDADDDDLDVQDVDEDSATAGRTHEPRDEVSLTQAPRHDDQDRLETTKDAGGDQLTRSIDEARETTRDAGVALPGDALVGHALQAAKPLERGLGSSGSADTTATPMAAVSASPDPGTGKDGSLADVASQARGDEMSDEDRSAPTADVAGKAHSAALRIAPANEKERTTEDGPSPGALTQDQSETLGGQTTQPVDVMSDDEFWAYVNDPQNSLRNRSRRSASAALPDGSQGRRQVDDAVATDVLLEDIKRSQSPPGNQLLQQTRSAPPADAVVSEVSGNVDSLGAGSEIGSQPAALAPVETQETAGTVNEAVTSQAVIAPVPSRLAEGQTNSAGEINDTIDGTKTPTSAPVTSPQVNSDDPKRSEAESLSVPGEEEPRHDVGHPLAISRGYRHDVLQTAGSKVRHGYEVERLSVKLDDSDDPA
jgi:hypothetical protein